MVSSFSNVINPNPFRASFVLSKKEKKPSASMKLISKKLHQELTTSLDNKEVAVEAEVTTTGMTTPGPAAMVAATCMAAVVGVNNPWVMEAGDPMAVAPGAAVRCNAGGAGAEAVVDLIEGFLHFFLFF